MLRHLAGWLLDAIALDPDPKPTIACNLGWHHPGEIRRNGVHIPVGCVERGCPVYEAARNAR